MIQLLFFVLFVEGFIALLLMLKIGPLRDLVMKALEQLKSGKGPATVKTIACTISLIFASSILSILKIQSKGAKLGTLTPMDQVLWRTNLLEASLMGFSLFLGLVIDRLHHYLQKLIGLRTKVGSSKQEVEKLEKILKEKEEITSKDIGLLKEQILNLTEDLKKLKLESEGKEKQLLSSVGHVTSLQKQNEDLLLEYDRLLEDNQNLQTQILGYRI